LRWGKAEEMNRINPPRRGQLAFAERPTDVKTQRESIAEHQSPEVGPASGDFLFVCRIPNESIDD
jgi:hypothetical protein